jgi:ABC-type multidrug transport system ATPase subunit
VSDALVIDVVDVRKDYDGVEALRGLTFHVPAGRVCGFLGKNGAGKTTTIKMLLGMAKPSAGQIKVFGLSASEQASSVEIRKRTGFVSEEKDLYDFMTVDEMIRFTRAFFPRWRADLAGRYLKAFELPGDRKVKALSRGMRTKLALLLALSRGAELLILDEPTAGLDPAVSEEVLQAIVTHVANEELTVFFSSHQISEVDQIADAVVIIDRGRAIVSGELDSLREQFRRIELVFEKDAPDFVFRTPGVQRVKRKGRVMTILAGSGADFVIDEARPLAPVSVEVAPVTLKEIFLETTQRED